MDTDLSYSEKKKRKIKKEKKNSEKGNYLVIYGIEVLKGN